jgi:hypothetical protein
MRTAELALVERVRRRARPAHRRAGDLEHSRRRACNIGLIHWWFNTIEWILLDRDAMGVDNPDEMHCDTNKKLRVVVEGRKVPLVESTGKLPRITAVATINAAGFQRMTLFIVPKLRKLGDLHRFAGRCFIGASDSGSSTRMTKAMWTMYCFLYLAEVTRHFLTLGTIWTGPAFANVVDDHHFRFDDH